MDNITKRLSQAFEFVLYFSYQQTSLKNSKKEGPSEYMENALP